MASRVHGRGKTTHKPKKPKLTAAQKAERKIASYIHGHQRHGSPIAAAATHDAWKHKGMRTK